MQARKALIKVLVPEDQDTHSLRNHEVSIQLTLERQAATVLIALACGRAVDEMKHMAYSGYTPGNRGRDAKQLEAKWLLEPGFRV